MNIELPISPDYVKSWTFAHAIRELLQNAIDQEVTSPDNTMTVTYDPEAQVLRIANKSSALDRSSLLLGVTTKSGDQRTIGQFGEGYKLALLVLTRLNHAVRILNYKSKESWIPRFVHSAKLGATVLTIQIVKYRFTKVPDHDLTFEVYGVDPDQWLTIQANTLHLQDQPRHELITSQGAILTGHEQRGRIYVNGLYVTTNKDLHFGYNFKPQYVQLDRDRTMVRDFDVQWSTSYMWAELAKDHHDMVMMLLERDAPDIKYVENVNRTSLKDQAEANFVSRHGPTAVPIVNEDSRQSWARHEGVKTVIVPTPYYALITGSSHYAHRAMSLTKSTKLVMTPYEVIKQFHDDNTLSERTESDWDELLETSKDWKAP